MGVHGCSRDGFQCTSGCTRQHRRSRYGLFHEFSSADIVSHLNLSQKGLRYEILRLRSSAKKLPRLIRPVNTKIMTLQWATIGVQTEGFSTQMDHIEGRLRASKRLGA